jgi:hypothetical protein
VTELRHREDPNWLLPSFDAQDWAEAFNETAMRLGYSHMDEGWLIGWFANALMRGFDEGIRQAAVELERCAQERGRQ